jgi:hypothetical protein
LTLHDRRSPLKPHSSTLFALVIFGIGFCVFASAGLDLDPSIYTSLVVGTTDMYHCAELFVG